MGAAQSLLSAQNVVAAVLLAGVTASVWCKQGDRRQHILGRASKPVTGRKGKKKKAAGGKQDSEPFAREAKFEGRNASPELPSLSEHTIPGSIPDSGADVPSPKPLKERKKKAKKDGATAAKPAESRSSAIGPSTVSTPVPQPDGRSKPIKERQQEPWTRVETRRKTSGRHTTSETGITTTSVEEDGSLASAIEQSEEGSSSKKVRKGPKTPADGALENPDRVLRGVTPAPAAGFSWGDYEDAEEFGGDADGEGDDGWGIVKSRGRAKHHQQLSSPLATPAKAPETMTKKERQRAAKQQSEKLAKKEAEDSRLATLAKHRRERESAEIAEMYKGQEGGKKLSGGMSSYVNSKGHLVWD